MPLFLLSSIFDIFDVSSFPARWSCGEWSGAQGWLYIISNLAIWASYFAIPVILIYFIKKRSDLPFSNLIKLFIAFILFCGITHFNDALIFWIPIYRLNAWMLFLTAIVSLACVFQLLKSFPKFIELRTPDQLEKLVVNQTEALVRSNEKMHAHEIKLAQQLKQSELLSLRLSHQNDQLKDFASISSHNLRGPVGNIQSLLELYRLAENDAEQHEIINKIDGVTKSLFDTVEDLSKIMTIRTEPIDNEEELSFENVLEKTKQAFAADLRNYLVEIESNFEQPTIKYPKVFLESIITNLLSNAIKYRSEFRVLRVNISTYTSKGKIHLIFSDNGSGIDLAKHQRKIFQLRKTFHGNSDARGVGLYMIRTQIEAKGGKITVESTPDVGTTFTIIF